MKLAGKTVILTGASGGIGAALCHELVEAGAKVLAVGRSTARLAELARANAPEKVLPLTADLSTEEGRDRLLAASRDLEQAPSILVLAHAQSGFGLFEQQLRSDIEAMLHTNLVAPTLLIHQMLPVLRRQPEACVVAVGSTFGSIGFPGYAGYSASKFGLRGLFEAMAREHADDGVRFQYLAPRATRTAFNSPEVDALNRALNTKCDDPADVAVQLREAIERGDLRRQLGWPEKLFARLNGLLPGLVDRALRGQLAVVKRHATRHGAHVNGEELHETRTY